MHVFEVGMVFGYLFVVWWVVSNLADDEEGKAPRDLEPARIGTRHLLHRESGHGMLNHSGSCLASRTRRSMPMPALPPYITEPIWEQFCALLPEREVDHPLGCHRPRIYPTGRYSRSWYRFW